MAKTLELSSCNRDHMATEHKIILFGHFRSVYVNPKNLTETYSQNIVPALGYLFVSLHNLKHTQFGKVHIMCSHQTWTRCEYSTVSHSSPGSISLRLLCWQLLGNIFRIRGGKWEKTWWVVLAWAQNDPVRMLGEEREAEYLLKASHTLRVGATQEIVWP